MRVIKIKMLGRHHLNLKVLAAKRGVPMAKIVRDLIDEYPDVPYTNPDEEIQYTTVALEERHIEKLRRMADSLRSDISGAFTYMIDNKGRR